MTIPSDPKLGRCEIRSKLGEGGMGEVYRARDAMLNREVAINILPVLFIKLMAEIKTRNKRYRREFG